MKLLEWVPRFIFWLGSFVVDSKTGKPSVKRVGLAMSVTALVMIMLVFAGVAAAVVWLSHNDASDRAQLVGRLVDGITYIAGLVLAAVTTGYLVDKSSQRKHEKEDPDEAP